MKSKLPKYNTREYDRSYIAYMCVMNYVQICMFTHALAILALTVSQPGAI